MLTKIMFPDELQFVLTELRRKTKRWSCQSHPQAKEAFVRTARQSQNEFISASRKKFLPPTQKPVLNQYPTSSPEEPAQKQQTDSFTRAEQEKQTRRRYEAVRQLHQQGVSIRGIARGCPVPQFGNT